MTMKNHTRSNGRLLDQLRPVSIQLGVNKFAEGSALIDVGDTRVLATASIERRVPRFLEDSGKGWLTAEYAMLPRATHTRSQREVSRGRPSGRTSEIQRLIGRSLRAVVDLRAMPGLTVTVDCDVLQADGGTRTASICCGYVAVVQALAQALAASDLDRWPMLDSLAAISVGLVKGAPSLDLDYAEDSSAEVDMNIVGTGSGQVVEIQGTGEERSFSREELNTLVDLAFDGLRILHQKQQEVLTPVLEQVASVEKRRERRPASPKSEGDLWGDPEKL